MLNVLTNKFPITVPVGDGSKLNAETTFRRARTLSEVNSPAA